MGKKIIGNTVGTPMRPQSVIEKTGYAEQIRKNTEDVSNVIGALGKVENNVADQQHAINALTANDIDVEYYMTVKNHSVTPEMFGAVGDGRTDDTEALKQCLLQDKPVYLSGNYRITEDLFITRHNFVMFGKVGGYSVTSPTLYFENASLRINTGIFNTRLKGFAIRSNTIGLLLDGEERMGNFLFEDLQFICKKCAKLDVESGYIWFVNCKFTSDGATDDCLIDMRYTGTASNRLNYVYFDRCAMEGASIPDNLNIGVLMRLGNCAAINITNCDLCNANMAVTIDTSRGASTNIKMTNNYFWSVSLALNMTGINDSLFANNVLYNRSSQPLLIGEVNRKNAVIGNVFTYWTSPTVGKVAGNIFKGNVISAKSCSLERIAPREDLINVEKTHLISLGAGESTTKTFNMKICYVDTLYVTCSDKDITHTSSLSADGNTFTVTLTNPTTEEKEFLMFIH